MEKMVKSQKNYKYVCKKKKVPLSKNTVHTELEGVKIALQFPNNELWWASKSTFQGLKKYVFKKKTTRPFREN